MDCSGAAGGLPRAVAPGAAAGRGRPAAPQRGPRLHPPGLGAALKDYGTSKGRTLKRLLEKLYMVLRISAIAYFVITQLEFAVAQDVVTDIHYLVSDTHCFRASA